jgi:two-component system chemotaxis response regulator CheB
MALPRGLPQPILVVLHIDAMFGAALNAWFAERTRHQVVAAKDGEALLGVAGKVVMAVPGQHLAVRGGRLRLTDDPPRHSCRPSVDVLFESVAEELGAGAVAGLLTGMGRDGAAGLLAVRRAGGQTVAQDEATSVVYGMPREAALLGAAERVLPLPEIGPALQALSGGRRG